MIALLGPAGVALAGIVSDIDREKSKPETPDDDDTRPLTGEPVAPMRLRAEPPRVTRLSRKVLAGLGLVGRSSSASSTSPRR